MMNFVTAKITRLLSPIYMVAGLIVFLIVFALATAWVERKAVKEWLLFGLLPQWLLPMTLVGVGWHLLNH